MHEPDMEFAGDPRQFDFVAANGHIVSPNVGAGGLRARMPPYVGARRRNAGMPPNVGAGWPNAGMPY